MVHQNSRGKPGSTLPTVAPGLPRLSSTVFDTAVFLANLVVVGPLTKMVQVGEDISPRFGVLLLVGVLAYSTGAWLKRIPLQTRMTHQPAWGGGALLLFLVLGTMHLGVFMLAGALGLEALGVPEGWSDGLGLSLGLLPTILAVFALLPMRQAPAPDESPRRPREAAADAGLWFGTVVLFALWEGAIVPTVAGKAGGSIILSAVLVVLMTVPFALFYLAPRMLFLAEDFRRGSTWLRIALVALPVAWRLVRGPGAWALVLWFYISLPPVPVFA